MKNTPENKAKFFAQYWGQEIMHYTDHIEMRKFKVNSFRMDLIHNKCLQLRPLASLTDEEKETYMSIGNDNILRYLEGMINTTMKVGQVDYLRSIGIAIPFMGLSVDQLVEYGWIKLTTK